MGKRKTVPNYNTTLNSPTRGQYPLENVPRLEQFKRLDGMQVRDLIPLTIAEYSAKNIEGISACVVI